MKKNGFTLVELLAVVSILSLLLLLVVPKIVNQLNNSKEEVNDTTKKVIYSATEKYMKDYNADTKDKYCILVSDLIDENYLSDSITDNNTGIDISRKSVEILYNENSGYEYRLVDNCELCTLVSDEDNSGTITVGDEYACNVNETDTFNFYVLGTEGEGANEKVNLIMDRNICNDGTIEYTSTNYYCRYQWYSAADNNTYGPTTVMAELYAGTKEWANVPDMIMNYKDENNGDSENKGYTNIVTNNGVTTITGKPTTNTTTVGTLSKPLKARLPMMSEVTVAGCIGSSGSCPIWLMENIKYSSVTNDKYSMNNNSEAYQNIQGYWLLSSNPDYSGSAHYVYCNGSVSIDDTTNGNYGARPVITVPKAYLQTR